MPALLVPILSIDGVVTANVTGRNYEYISSATDIAMYWYSVSGHRSEKWSEAVYPQLDSLRKSFTNADYYLYSYARARWEDRDALEADMPLLGVGALLLALYCLLATLNMRLRGNRVVLTALGLLSTALSLLAAFSIMITAGVPFVAISLIIPFVVIGTHHAPYSLFPL